MAKKKQRKQTAGNSVGEPAAESAVSAQVVLRPAGGQVPTEAAVTATIDQYRPDPGAVESATAFFRKAGFEVGPLVGNSFSITAPASTFERRFGTKLRSSRSGLRAEATGSYELPAGVLPAPLAKAVHAITFTPPPDFGPTNFG